MHAESLLLEGNSGDKFLQISAYVFVSGSYVTLLPICFFLKTPYLLSIISMTLNL